jgi:hypothetical protein
LADSARLEADIVRFGRHHRASGDIDPTYPVLRHLAAAWGLDRDRALWLVALYVAYYHLPAALLAFDACPEPVRPRAGWPQLPTGTERRGHRDHRKLAAHLDAYVAATAGGQAAWWLAGLRGDAVPDYRLAYAKALALHGNGRWAAFKWCDLLMHTIGLPLRCPDMLLGESSGPLAGLALLYGPGGAATIAGRSRLLRGLFAAHAAPLRWDELETVLCDFHALHAGRYYVGHDIDEMLGRAAGLPPHLLDPLLAARAAAFAPCYLGEARGWAGIDRARRGRYRRTGSILVRTPDGDAEAA